MSTLKVNESWARDLLSTEEETNSFSTYPNNSRDVYLGIRFLILIIVFVSVYLCIWLCQRQLTRAFLKSHEGQNRTAGNGQQSQTILCPLLFLIPVQLRGTPGDRRRCCPTTDYYDIRNFIGWNAGRNGLNLDRLEVDIEGNPPPKYEDVLLIEDNEMMTPPTYEDATKMQQQEKEQEACFKEKDVFLT